MSCQDPRDSMNDDFAAEWDNPDAIESRDRCYYVPHPKGIRVGVSRTDVDKPLFCLLCGEQLVVREGRFGPFLGCPGFPNCRFSISILDPAEGWQCSVRQAPRSLLSHGPSPDALSMIRHIVGDPVMRLAEPDTVELLRGDDEGPIAYSRRPRSDEDEEMTGYSKDPDVGDW